MTARAFEHLNLRWNPFGEATRDERRGFAIERVAVPAPGAKLQVIGEAGHGKSSALLALLARMPDARYLYTPLPEQAPPPVIADDEAPLLLDEAQRLPRARLRALLRSARTVVFGTHEDLRSLDSTLATVALRACPVELLRSIVDARLTWATRRAGPVPRPTPRLLDALLARHHGDVRGIEAELYSRYQGLQEVSDVDL